MKRKDVTAELSEKVAKKLRRKCAIVAQEVWVDDDHRVDFVAFTPGPGGRNTKLEHGRFIFVEVRSSMHDFKSGHGLTFLGDDNWLVCPHDLADELRDKQLLPFGVQVYCPDRGGTLRLAYCRGLQGMQNPREDSTLCLLWTMLMDSYTRWRTTGDVFSEAVDVEVDGKFGHEVENETYATLADFIDRRACRMRDVGDEVEQVYRCSECGEEYCMSDIPEFPWRFCPMCGAEVAGGSR
nr:MAG TPA: DNA repair protein MmcB-like protein [Caudoviricetes sp.]